MDRVTILNTNFTKIHLVRAELFNTETDRQTDGWTERKSSTKISRKIHLVRAELFNRETARRTGGWTERQFSTEI
jgi:hypothetical protein